MNVFFLVNEVAEIEASQTTAMLIAKSAARGHRTLVFGVADWSLTPEGRLTGRAASVPADGASLQEMVERLAATPRTPVALSSGDALLLRTNPARDAARGAAHEASMGFARVARSEGVSVANDPDGLQRFGNKLAASVGALARWAPKTLITRRREDVAAFVTSHEGRTVLKPLAGTRGRGVFLVRRQDQNNLAALCDVLFEDGYAMVQEFVPEAVDGDTRVVMLDGAVLTVDGHHAAVRRIPAPEDFRSNIHAGGHVAPAALTEPLLAMADAVGTVLMEAGIRLAGLDVIGSQIVEINVFATGGLRDAERYTGADFCGAIIDALVPAESA